LIFYFSLILVPFKTILVFF